MNKQAEEDYFILNIGLIYASIYVLSDVILIYKCLNIKDVKCIIFGLPHFRAIPTARFQFTICTKEKAFFKMMQFFRELNKFPKCRQPVEKNEATFPQPTTDDPI